LRQSKRPGQSPGISANWSRVQKKWVRNGPEENSPHKKGRRERTSYPRGIGEERDSLRPFKTNKRGKDPERKFMGGNQCARLSRVRRGAARGEWGTGRGGKGGGWPRSISIPGRQQGRDKSRWGRSARYAREGRMERPKKSFASPRTGR